MRDWDIDDWTELGTRVLIAIVMVLPIIFIIMILVGMGRMMFADEPQESENCLVVEDETMPEAKAPDTGRE